MTEHEEPIDDAGCRRRVRGLSPAELLGTLTDGAPTEGDMRMLMERRVGLAAEGCAGFDGSSGVQGARASGFWR